MTARSGRGTQNPADAVSFDKLQQCRAALNSAGRSRRRCVWRIVTCEPDFTGNRAAKLRKWAESHRRDAPRGSETMGAAKQAAMEKLRVISRKFCRG